MKNIDRFLHNRSIRVSKFRPDLLAHLSILIDRCLPARRLQGIVQAVWAIYMGTEKSSVIRA
jgi:hypothetical protein